MFGASVPVEREGAPGFAFEALLRVGEYHMDLALIDPVIGYSCQELKTSDSTPLQRADGLNEAQQTTINSSETHLFVMGADLGYPLGDNSFESASFLVLGARSVMGSSAEGFTGGLRSVFALDMILRAIRLEVAHQALWRDGEMSQSVSFMIGFDVPRIFFPLAFQ